MQRPNVQIQPLAKFHNPSDIPNKRWYLNQGIGSFKIVKIDKIKRLKCQCRGGGRG